MSIYIYIYLEIFCGGVTENICRHNICHTSPSPALAPSSCRHYSLQEFSASPPRLQRLGGSSSDTSSSRHSSASSKDAEDEEVLEEDLGGNDDIFEDNQPLLPLAPSIDPDMNIGHQDAS